MIKCSFENGDQVLLRHVSVNAVVIKNSEVLLCKRGTFRGNPILESGKWGLVGGFLDRDEDIEQALKREAMEETGYVIDNFQLLHIKDYPDRPAEDRQNVEFVCVAEVQDHTPANSEEVRELKWFPLDNLPPKETVAFDHYDDLLIYKEYLNKKITLPVVGKYHF